MPEITNCRNCGAPLTGCECEYCGTRYGKNKSVGSFIDNFIAVMRASSLSMDEAVDLYGAGVFTPNEARAAAGLTEIEDDRRGAQNLYADNVPVLEIEDKPASPFQWPEPIPGVWTH